LALIVAYGLILPKNIIESTKFGCINIHPSLLPKYRGAAPIQSSLLNGDKISGMTIIQMDEGVDSGDILLQEKCELGDDDYPVLAEKFANMGAKMAIDAIRGVFDGSISGIAQDNSLATYSKKILKTDAKIDLEQGVDQVLNKIRAFSDFMTAFIELRGDRIKIFKAQELVAADNTTENGENNLEIDENFVEFEGGFVNKDFVFKCGDGRYFQPLILQKAGKGRVVIKDFLLGFRA
jgi:methionyl-tRNA formyltransferase